MPLALGTSTPTTYKLGSSPVSALYLGTVLVWSANTDPLNTFSAGWTAAGMVLNAAKTNATVATAAGQQLDGATFVVGKAGTITITSTRAHCDYDLVFYKNGVAAFTAHDNTGGNGYDGAINATIVVARADTITIGKASDFTGFTALSVTIA